MVMHTDSNKLYGSKFIFQWLHWWCNICDTYLSFFALFEREQIQVTRNQSLGWVFILMIFFLLSPDGTKDHGRARSRRQVTFLAVARGRYSTSPVCSWRALANDVSLSFTQAKGASWVLYPHLCLPISKALSYYCHQLNLLCCNGFQILFWPYWIPFCWTITAYTGYNYNCSLYHWAMRN